MGGCVAAAAWGGLLLVRSVSAAQLRFEVPEHCGDAASFLRDLDELVGDPERALRPSALRITGAEEGYRLRLEVGGEVRELVDADCRTLLRSAVVITAAAGRMAPSAGEAAAASPAPAESPAKRRAAGAGAASVSRPNAAAPEARQLAGEPIAPALFSVGLGLGVSSGVLPGTGPVLEARAGLEPRPFGLAINARYWPGAGAEREGRNVHITALGASVAGQFRLGTAFHLGIGLEVDRLTGSGQEGVSGRSSDAAWRVAPTLDLDIIPWSIEDLRIEFGFGAQLALLRPRFIVTGFGDVYATPRLAGAAIIRGVWLFR